MNANTKNSCISLLSVSNPKATRRYEVRASLSGGGWIIARVWAESPSAACETACKVFRNREAVRRGDSFTIYNCREIEGATAPVPWWRDAGEPLLFLVLATLVIVGMAALAVAMARMPERYELPMGPGGHSGELFPDEISD